MTLLGVETPCHRCQGLGRRCYSNTSTWRGGAGGAKPTVDVCDHCWGTGDEHMHGTDVRELVAEVKRLRGTVTIHVARSVAPGSWLRDPRYCAEWFLAGHDYAQSQTYAIPVLAKCSPEELFHTVGLILRGCYRAGLKPPGEDEL